MTPLPLFPPPEVRPPAAAAPTSPALALPAAVASSIWRGNQLGSPVTDVIPTGWPALDAALPGGGWPCRSISEVLQPQPSVCEWRLLAPMIRQVVKRGQHVVVVGPPKEPNLIRLRHYGLDDKHLTWVKADSPSRRLWCTEQLVRGNSCGLVIVWIDHAKAAEMRRLQVSAQGCEAPVIAFRPEAARHEPSAAPLRLILRFGIDWELLVEVFKRKGSPFEEVLRLPSIPGGLESILTPRLRFPSRLIADRELRPHALGSTPSRQAVRRRLTA